MRACVHACMRACVHVCRDIPDKGAVGMGYLKMTEKNSQRWENKLGMTEGVEWP